MFWISGLVRDRYCNDAPSERRYLNSLGEVKHCRAVVEFVAIENQPQEAVISKYPQCLTFALRRVDHAIGRVSGQRLLC